MYLKLKNVYFGLELPRDQIWVAKPLLFHCKKKNSPSEFSSQLLIRERQRLSGGMKMFAEE